MRNDSLAISLLSHAIDAAQLELGAASTKVDERAAFAELVRLRECLEKIRNPQDPDV